MMRGLVLVLVLAACRPDPGDPDYPDPGSLGDTGDTGIPRGPDPYEAGEQRLSVGLFYESGYSDLVAINDQDTHYYIYSNTFTQSVDTLDVVEGRESAVITHGSVGWFGGGITWDVPRDMSAWTTMYVSLRSPDPSFTDIALHYIGGGEGIVDAADYGWLADGQWHHLAIPLADMTTTGVDPTAITGPFVIIGAGGEAGAELKIDNLYYTAE